MSMNKIEINLNQDVKVRLDEEALSKKQKELDEFNTKFHENIKLKIDKDGYYHDQLYSIMQDFGDMICGCYSPIKDCKIIIEF